MFGVAILEVAIGLILVYALLGLITSALTELVSQRLSLRSKYLKHALQQMLDDESNESLSDRVYAHPLIAALSRKKGKLPSYLPREQFARAVLAQIPGFLGSGTSSAEENKPIANPTDLRDAIDKIENKKIKQVLSAFAAETDASLKGVQRELGLWFDDTMARASGWYRRKIGVFLLIIGAVLVIALNADTIQIARTLYLSPSLRASVVAHAEAKVAEHREVSGNDSSVDPREIVDENIAALGPLIGWSVYDQRRLGRTRPRVNPELDSVPPLQWAWIEKALGLVVTTVAVSLGSPFWFDLLGKFVSLRSSIREPIEFEKNANGPRGKAS